MSEQKNKKITPVIEYVSESTMACLFTMVQGNIFALTAVHFAVAAQTGVLAGIGAVIMLYITKARNRYIVAAILAILTAIVDYFVHPGNFGSVITEAIVTGIGAGILSLIISYLIDYFRKPKSTQ